MSILIESIQYALCAPAAAAALYVVVKSWRRGWRAVINHTRKPTMKNEERRKDD